MGEPSKKKIKFDEENGENLTEEELREKLRILDNDILSKKLEIQSMEMMSQQVAWGLEENKFILSRLNRPPFVVSTINQQWSDEENPPGISGKDDEKEGAKKRTIIKTSTRRSIYLEDPGLVPPENLIPGDEVCVNRESGVIVTSVPKDFDQKVKAMEVIEKPADRYCDIAGLDAQIQELVEAVVLPIKNKNLFNKMNIQPSKGALLYGPPGTGKTMMARACAAETESTFLKLSATLLVQHYIGEGAKMVREAFTLAKMKAPTIIFIDEIDAIGGKRFDSDKAGDREVQRTMMELLNQLDGFSPNDSIKVIAATNRIESLDSALLRSGRLDKKIEIPEPDELARIQIFQLNGRKMNLAEDVNFTELSRITDGLNAATCKAICTEAALTAIRRNADKVSHQDFIEGLADLLGKKKTDITSYS